MNLNVLGKSLGLLKGSARCSLRHYRTEYQSAISLKALYPDSSLKLTTPDEKEINEKSNQTFTGYIPIEKLEISSCRSSGPGGQRVNKINTKVELRFHLSSADWIPEKMRTNLLELKKNQLTKEGYLIIRSDKTRSYQMNLADALQRLRTIIYNAEEIVPEVKPLKVVEIRKRLEKANRERLKEKRFRSLIEQSKRDYE